MQSSKAKEQLPRGACAFPGNPTATFLIQSQLPRRDTAGYSTAAAALQCKFCASRRVREQKNRASGTMSSNADPPDRAAGVSVNEPQESEKTLDEHATEQDSEGKSGAYALACVRVREAATKVGVVKKMQREGP